MEYLQTGLHLKEILQKKNLGCSLMFQKCQNGHLTLCYVDIRGR